MTHEEANYQAMKFNLEQNNAREINGVIETDEIIPKPTLEQWVQYKNEKGIVGKEEEIIQVREDLKKNYQLIKVTLDEYLDIPSEHKTIISLWIIGTYLHGEFEAYPYLFLNAMRGSGKTRALKLITTLSNGNVLISPTEAVLFRTKGCLGIDEFESLGSKEKQAIRELLNASYKKGIKVIRMKKKKTLEGEGQIVEEFEPYRPIIMANIWGIEEVLADRCITLILEKSNRQLYTKLIEDFSTNPDIKQIICTFNSIKCSLCSVVIEKKQTTSWNDYVKSKYTPDTLNALNTETTLTTKETIEELFFNKIDDTGLDGRNLELFFPLFLIANQISDLVLDDILSIAKKKTQDRKLDEMTESKDVALYKLVANQEENKPYRVGELANILKLTLGEGENEWLNAKWLGRALKRLNLTIDKRRVGEGIEVTLNIAKAKEKLEIFK